MTGDEQLREQLETMRKSLRVFDHPIVEEMPGLRLMHESLKEREQHIADQIAKNETCTIELTLANAAHGHDAVPATLVAYVLDAVSAAVQEAGLDRAAAWSAPPAPTDLVVALSCHVQSLEIDGDDATITVSRPPGPVAAQVADPDSGAPLFEHAAADAFAVVAGEERVPEHLRSSLRGLAEAVEGGELILRWSLEPFALEAAEGSLDQTAAQRLAQRCLDSPA